MDDSTINAIHTDAITNARQIENPAARFRQLLDIAPHGGGERDALFAEAADIARSFDEPKERAGALWSVFRAAVK